MTSLPFTVRLADGRRFWRVMGILTIGADGIVVEWRSDEFVKRWGPRRSRHVGRGPLHSVVLPWQLLDSMSYDGRFVRAGSLHVRARTMNAFEGLPSADGPYWSVRIARHDRRRAREFVLAAEAALNATIRLLQHRTRV